MKVQEVGDLLWSLILRTYLIPPSFQPNIAAVLPDEMHNCTHMTAHVSETNLPSTSRAWLWKHFQMCPRSESIAAESIVWIGQKGKYVYFNETSRLCYSQTWDKPHTQLSAFTMHVMQDDR